MNSEEFEKLCSELRAQYAPIAKKEHPDADSEEIEELCDGAIMNELWKMFQDEKIEKEDLIKMAGQLGYEYTGDESDNVGSQVVATDDGNVKISGEDIEEAQGYNDEESERKEARKLYGFEDEDEDEKEKR